jgi:photosystem II stability/assembly factor-like uncharacterized protein
VIEDARRRQRRHRGFALAAGAAGAGIAAILLASGGGGHSGSSTRAGSGAGGSGASRAHQSQQAQQIARVAAHHTIGEARLVAPGTGWGMNGLAFYWTADDGRTWGTLEPPILRGEDVIAKVADVAYAAPGHVWMALNDIIGHKAVNGSLRYATIARTSDGGRNWHESAPPRCIHECGELRLDFLNAVQGFVLTAGGDEGKLDRLYSTANGGAGWRLVGRAPFVGPIAFTSARDGWGISDPTVTFGPKGQTLSGAGVLYRTVDGGRAWQRVRLVAPRDYRGMASIADSIATFGPRRAVVPVRYRNPATGAQHLVLYTTANAGRTWSAHATPAAANLRADQWGYDGAVAFTSPSPTAWLFFAGSTLYATADAGREWRATRSVLAPTHPYGISFTSLATGWALFPVGYGPDSGVALVRTTDGGMSWTALAP